MTSMEFCRVSAGQGCGQGTLGTWGVTGPAAHPRHICGVSSVGAVSTATPCLLCLHGMSADNFPSSGSPGALGWRHHILRAPLPHAEAQRWLGWQ